MQAAITEEYGADRVAWVLANTVQKQYYDGRYSSSNQAWAKNLNIPADLPSFHLNTHPAIIDGLISRFREADAERSQKWKPAEKPSILAALKEGAEKAKQQPAADKSHKKSKETEI